MPERLLKIVQEPVAEEGILAIGDFVVVQCMIDGMTEKRMAELGINLGSWKAQIARKMQDDQSLFDFLRDIRRLPFVSQNFLTPTDVRFLFCPDRIIEM